MFFYTFFPFFFSFGKKNFLRFFPAILGENLTVKKSGPRFGPYFLPRSKSCQTFGHFDFGQQKYLFLCRMKNFSPMVLRISYAKCDILCLSLCVCAVCLCLFFVLLCVYFFEFHVASPPPHNRHWDVCSVHVIHVILSCLAVFRRKAHPHMCICTRIFPEHICGQSACASGKIAGRPRHPGDPGGCVCSSLPPLLAQLLCVLYELPKENPFKPISAPLSPGKLIFLLLVCLPCRSTTGTLAF